MKEEAEVEAAEEERKYDDLESWSNGSYLEEQSAEQRAILYSYENL
jgi:hypothetical protein